MKDPLIRRIRFVGLRFTREEFEKIEQLRKETTTPEISEFIRRCIFDKPLTVRQRNASLDDCMLQLIELKNELGAIGHNLNQAVRQLNTFKTYKAVEDFLQHFDGQQADLWAKVNAIQSKVSEISDTWLQ